MCGASKEFAMQLRLLLSLLLKAEVIDIHHHAPLIAVFPCGIGVMVLGYLCNVFLTLVVFFLCPSEIFWVPGAHGQAFRF